jgi:hypothetical protein
VDAFRVQSATQKLDLVNTLQTVLDYGRRTVDESVWTDEGGVAHVSPVLEDPDPEADAWGLLRMPPITQLVDEFGVYRLDDKKLVQDCVMAVALAVERAWMDRAIAAPVAGGLY